MHSQLLTTISACLLVVFAETAAAQVFTPTRVPQTLVVEPPDDLVPLEILDADERCIDQSKRQPRRILEALKSRASAIRRIYGQAYDRVQPAPVKGSVIYEGRKRLDKLSNDIQDAIVDLSVADRRQKWDAAVVKGQTAARNLSGSPRMATDDSRALAAADHLLELPKSFFNTDEAIAVTRHRKAATCVADSLGQQARVGPPAGFGSPKTAWFLPGAGFTAAQDSTDVNLKAAEFFFSNHWRLYVHSTVTVEQAKDEEAEAAEPAEEINSPDANEVSETVKSALLNPYGSPLYLTTGYLRKIRTPFFDGDANDGHHGLFLDSRVGLKFMPLPEEGLELVEGKSTNTAFYVASAAVRLRLPLYKEAPFIAGEDGIDVAVTGVLNRISRRSASTLFVPAAEGEDPVIPPTLAAANLEIGVSLPKLANVVISGTLWSNSKFDRRFQLSINLQKSDTEVPKPSTSESK